MKGRRVGRPHTVAVIDATPASVEQARTARAEGCPEASVWRLPDDRLIDDALEGARNRLSEPESAPEEAS